MVRFLFLFITLLATVAAKAVPDPPKVSISGQNVPLQKIIREIERQTGLSFFYNNKLVDVSRRVSVDVTEMDVNTLLKNIFQDQPVEYTVTDSSIILSKANEQGNGEQPEQQPLVRVTGKVVDREGSPLAGATVVDKLRGTGSVTDGNGDFAIMTVDNAILKVSTMGFESSELRASSFRPMIITLGESENIIGEVVAIGYTTRSREKLISSVSTVSNQELNRSTVPNLENALAGRAAGVFSRQTSGEPGSDGGNIQIRGFGSALVVVDGIPGRDYSQIDPSEIESISILKDASAAAVYGMQGANGVILVTTQRGKKNSGVTVEVNSRFGLQMPHNYPDVANADLWQTLVNEYTANMQLINDRNAVFSREQMSLQKYAYDTNWYDVMIKNAPINQTNVNITGGTDKVSYFLSGGYLYQGGIWATDATRKNRFNFRSNIDVDLARGLSASVGVGAIFNNLDYPGYGAATIARSLKETAPNIPVYWNGQNRHYAFGGEGTLNPMALADTETSGYSQYKYKDWNIDVSLDYDAPFLKGLSFRGVMGYSTNDEWQKVWSKNIVYTGYRSGSGEYYQSASADNSNKGALSLGDGVNWSVTWQGFLNYADNFNGHSINSGLVFEVSHAKTKAFNTSRGEFPSTVLDMLAGGLSNKQLTNSEAMREYRSASIIGRVSYDFRSRYFVDFNFRYDGAQYFADKWGLFPSASLGWMVTNENFMRGSKRVLNELKIRASWGQLGDLSSARSYYDNYELYYYRSGYRYPGESMTFGDRSIYGLSPTINPNAGFTWSRSAITNAGLDFKLWGGLLSGSAEYFYRSRTGLPAQKANDNAGVLASWYNLNSDNTRGFEIVLQHDNSAGGFRYSVGGNISWARQRNGYLEHGPYTSGYDRWKWYNGGQWSNIRWGLNQIGQYQSYEQIANAPMHDNSNNNAAILPGDLIYEDWNGDGYIDQYDMRPIARTAYPEIMYGINLSASWRGIDFSMLWQGGALSNFQISTFDMDAFEEGKTFRNTWAYFSDRWRKTDYSDPDSSWISGYFPAVRDMTAVTINRQASDYWMWNGSYLRLKNVELGYTLPDRWVGKAFKELRMYVNLYNCLTISAQKYFDPEQAESYFSFASYPQTMSFNAGINIKF